MKQLVNFNHDLQLYFKIIVCETHDKSTHMGEREAFWWTLKRKMTEQCGWAIIGLARLYEIILRPIN